MTMKTVQPVPNPLSAFARGRVPLSAVPGVLARGAWTVAQKVYLRWRHRQQIREMMEMDDHLLCDMGITRYDVFRAGSAPLTQSPGEILSRASGRRYSAPRRPIG